MMKNLNIIIKVYMTNPVMNTLILALIGALIWFIWVYRKLEALALIASLKAEMRDFLKGGQKLEYALNWVMKQSFYKNSVLKFIPAKVVKALINVVFNSNKATIESK